MNSTFSPVLVIFVNNSATTTVESWFIPLDILASICLILTIILATIFLFLIILDKTCHTVPMILTGNICLTGLICGIVHFSINVFALQNDLKQIQYQDSFCIFRGYLSYASAALHNYSYVSSAIYRYITIVYPTRLFWQSARMQILLIGLAWILAFIFPLLFIFTGEIIYNVDNQICQVPLRFSFSILYAPHFIYIIPVNLVIFIYLKLVRYVRGMNQRVTPANTLSRAQRDLKMVRRIVILIHILFIAGFPLTLFLFLSFANRAPKYHFRIGFIFVDASMLFIMIALFQFTDTLKASARKIINSRANRVVPIIGGLQLQRNVEQ
jgi:hypothetical protein